MERRRHSPGVVIGVSPEFQKKYGENRFVRFFHHLIDSRIPAAVAVLITFAAVGYCGYTNDENNVWANDVRGKLNGSISLGPGEQSLPQGEIVPAGRDFFGAAKMQEKGTLVNVRNYPAVNTTGLTRSEVIGQIPLGGTVHNTVVIQPRDQGSFRDEKWVAGRCNDIKPIFDNNGQRKNFGSDEICAVHADYVKRK